MSTAYILDNWRFKCAFDIFFSFIQILLPKLLRTFIRSGNFTDVNLPLCLFQIPDFWLKILLVSRLLGSSTENLANESHVEWERGNRITLLFDSSVHSGTLNAYFSIQKIRWNKTYLKACAPAVEYSLQKVSSSVTNNLLFETISKSQNGSQTRSNIESLGIALLCMNMQSLYQIFIFSV